MKKIIDVEELKKRKWPKPYFPIGQEVAGRKQQENDSEVTLYDDNGVQVLPHEGYEYNPIPYPFDYHSACYVNEEKVDAIPMDKAISPGSSGVVGLAKGANGIIYGVTAGRECHLFSYESGAKSTKNLALVCEYVQNACIAVCGDSIFLGIDAEARESGGLYLCDILNPVCKPEKIDIGIDEGVVALAMDGQNNLLYGLTVSGLLFLFDITLGELGTKGLVDKDNIFSSVLACDGSGNVYGAMRWGRLFCFSLGSDKITDLEISAPSIKGREFYNKVESLIFDSKSNTLYGGTSADGILFKMNIENKKIISLGKPLNQPRIRCLATGNDDSLYGIAGDKCCHLFKYNPEDGGLTDVGIFHAKKTRDWHGYEFDAAVSGNDGVIYFGENDRISHLFAYKF